MAKTICGVDVDNEGFLVTVSNNSERKSKPVVINYNNQQLYFCEESCKIEFLNAPDKEQWMKNHK
jgi:YHS domain-containing protein